MAGRKVCVVTGTRAEYGLLYWLMKRIEEDADLKLQVAVTGMHLSPEFGLTYRTIEQDGFHIDEKVEMLLSSDTPVGIAKSIGLATIGFADVYDRLRPDVVVLLGDRYEILAAAQAAMVANIPIAHIHGGETTEGMVDEAIRHSVTKMAHLHFTAAEPYRQRVIQLGENPEHVWNFGAPGLEYIRKLQTMTRNELEQSLEFELGNLNFLITYHPVTLPHEGSAKALGQLFEAVDRFPEAKVIITKPNSDSGGREISRLIDEYCASSQGRAKAYTSLGQVRYLSAVHYCQVVIGNSSSGIIEVPIFNKPTVNIGDRQKGRLRANSVIDVDESTSSIYDGIALALSDRFQNLDRVESPYGDGEVSHKIAEILKHIDLTTILSKRFRDLI